MWMLVAIMTMELLVVHPLVAWWSPTVAAVLSILSIAGISVLVAAIRSFRHRPVVLTETNLSMSAGFLNSVVLPLHAIAGVSGEIVRVEVEARSTLNLALIAWPNTLVRLTDERVVGRRRFAAVAHRLDDAPAFKLALAERLPRS